MSILSKSSINARICLLAGCCMTTIVVLLVGVSQYLAERTSAFTIDTSARLLKKDAEVHMTSVAEHIASQASNFFVSASNFGETLSKQFSLDMVERKGGQGAEAKLRIFLNQSVAAHGRANSDIFGLGLAFEPTPGADKIFENISFQGNEIGRFAVYHSNRIPSYTIPEKEIVYDGTPATYWYKCAREQLRTCLIPPFSYTNASGTTTLLSTIAIPLLSGTQALGGISVDIELAKLQEQAKAASENLYDGQARVLLVSPDGQIAADSSTTNNLGKLLPAIDPALSKALDALMVKRSTQTIDVDDNTIAVASVSAPGGRAWSTLIVVPSNLVTAPAQQLKSQLSSAHAESKKNQLLVAGLVVALALVAIAFLGRSITRPINRVSLMLQEIANGNGDLTKRISHQQNDEIGALVQGFNQFLDKLQPIIAAVTKAADETRVTATDAAHVAEKGNIGMQQQFKEIEQVASASQEMSATSHDVAENAVRAATAASTAEKAAREGLNSVAFASNTIGHLADHIDKAMSNANELAASSDKIGGVLEVIRSVADQTNLLALNAAIEAARAGESGRGFAVVADEVRHLAKRTQDSVDEIRGVIEELQRDTSSVVQAMSYSHAQVITSVEEVRRTTDVLGSINQAVEVINDMNLQIASAAEEQSAVSEEVSRNVIAIRDVTRDLATNSERSAKIARDLNELANQQQSLMSGFKV